MSKDPLPEPLTKVEVEGLKVDLRSFSFQLLAKEDELRRWRVMLDHMLTMGPIVDPTFYNLHADTARRWLSTVDAYLDLVKHVHEMIEKDKEVARERERAKRQGPDGGAVRGGGGPE